jgi:hypothetical protein
MGDNLVSNIFDAIQQQFELDAFYLTEDSLSALITKAPVGHFTRQRCSLQFLAHTEKSTMARLFSSLQAPYLP